LHPSARSGVDIDAILCGSGRFLLEGMWTRRTRKEHAL
jgi:hypothetical protein